MFSNKGSGCPYCSGHFLTGQSSEDLKVKSCQERDILKLSGNHSKWQRLKASLFTYLKRNKDLADAYTEAKVEKERSEARKISEEAEEIAAKKDLIKQKSVKEFTDIINDIFAVDSLPHGAKALKLAKLMEENPLFMAQFRRAEKVIEKSSLRNDHENTLMDESKNCSMDNTVVESE